MSQIGCEVLNQGYNCFFYSGELPDVHFKQWMFTQLAGINNLVGELNSQGDYEYKVPQDVCEKINNWLADSAYIYDNDYVADNMPTLLQTIIKSICQYNVRFICIDNLMTAIEYDSASELYRKQSEFVRELKSIASKYNVCILLVAHPRKESNGDNKHFQNDDISGSADITNRVDTVMVYSRAKPTKECKSPNWDSEVIVTKNRLTGRLINDNASVKLVYSTASKRIMQLGDTTVKAYNWENNFTAECENDF
jgi:twinkle protein